MADIETSNITATGNWDYTGGDIKVPAPAVDTDASTKKYVDDNAGGAPEGTAVLSTGEGGATKYLREDGDGTCSWQTPAAGGDVTAAINLTDGTIVQGDGGAKGVKTSTATVAQVATNVSHVAGNGSDHANVATNTADIATNVTAIGLNTTHSADNTQAHSDYLLNSGTDTAVGPLKTTADNSSADTEYIPNVLYNTDATPPTANTVPIGTLYIQYTA